MDYLFLKDSKPVFPVLLFAVFSLLSSIARGMEPESGSHRVNLLVDLSHDYTFNISNASRTQNEIFPGFTCVTANQTIPKLNLEPINALVVLMDGKLPYLSGDADALLDYVEEGGGLWIDLRTGGRYRESLNIFLEAFGLKSGSVLSEDPEEWGISAHAPSELGFPLREGETQFTASVGLHAGATGSVQFQVFGDDTLLFESGILRRGMREEVQLAMDGVQRLRLVTTDAGDGKGSDHSVWFDPRVSTADGVSRRLVLDEADPVRVGWAAATQDQHFDGQPLSGAAPAASTNKTTGLVPVSRLQAEGWPELPGVRARQPFPAPEDPSAWWVAYHDENGSPVVAGRNHGKGLIIFDTAGLYRAAIDKLEPQQLVMRRFLEYISRSKPVEPMRGGGGWQFSDGYRWDRITDVEGGLRIHHTDYSAIYVESSTRAYRETLRYLEDLTGLNEKQKATQIEELERIREETKRGAVLDLEVSGVDTLTLISTDGGDGIGSDHSIFAANYLVDAAGNRTQLRLEDAVEVEVGYGQARQDRLKDGSPLSIGGVEFGTGIFLHANGRMVFQLDGKYERFLSHVGCLDRASGGSVGFRVLADGREIWNDGKVYSGGVPGGDPNDANYVPEGVLFQLKYLPCIGSGFLLPQGAAVDLPPKLRDDWQVHLGMLSHEMGHAWSYPFTERIGEEASAFIFNNLVLHRHYGQRHGDSVTRRLTGYLAKNPDLDEIDLATTRSDFKYYMFIDLMIREYGEDIWKNYNLLKYALLNQEGAEWNTHAAAWLWSIAAGTDVFPYFNTAFDSSMDPQQVRLPRAAMEAGFDPERVGELYNVPLRRLSRQREIFGTLQRFPDVREFYKRELAEKGHPAFEG